VKSVSPIREIWIGLAEVAAGPECNILATGKAAFTNVLTYAETQDEYRRKVIEMMEHYGAAVLDINDIEPLRSRLEKTSVDDELLAIADELEPEHIRFGTLHTFPLHPQ
jgi:hypothetical protein